MAMVSRLVIGLNPLISPGPMTCCWELLRVYVTHRDPNLCGRVALLCTQKSENHNIKQTNKNEMKWTKQNKQKSSSNGAEFPLGLFGVPCKLVQGWFLCLGFFDAWLNFLKETKEKCKRKMQRKKSDSDKVASNHFPCHGPMRWRHWRAKHVCHM